MLAASLTSPAVEFGVEAAPVVARYTADETASSGFVLDHENGILRGARARLDASGAWLASWLAIQRLDGSIRYDGRTQIGIPLTTQTRLSLEEVQWMVGPSRGLTLAGGSLEPEAGALFRRINRDIQPTRLSGALTETMHSRAAVGRLLWRRPVLSSPDLSTELSAQYERPWHQELAVDTHGAIDPFTLQPQARPAWSAAARATLSPAQAWRIFLGCGYQAMRFGLGSPRPVFRKGLPVGIASYPGSLQQLRSLNLGLEKQF